jgi:AcrR family transcriptional regulator
MSQRKKEDVRDAILASSFRLFRDRGYNETTIPAIARAAGISTANVYVYFKSKLDILFTVYEPWLTERLDRLERSLRRVQSPDRKLQRLLLTVWAELPQEANGFANNVIQALSTSARSEGYSPHLRQVFQRRVAGWLADCLGLSARDSEAIAGVVLMAFDGFAINVHLAHGLACDPRTVRLVSDAFASARLQPAGGAAPHAASTRPARRR